jgi:uncharacterized protein YggE
MRRQALRFAILVCATAGAVMAFARFGGAQQITPEATPTPPICARPNVAASMLRATEPDVPPMTGQPGTYGTVQVVVSLDADSHIVGARIMSSPSAILNQAALRAARQSTFQTEIRGCRPIAADYIFTVDFPRTATYSVTSSGERTVSVVGEGSVLRAPDSAVVEARIVTHDDDAANVLAKNDATFDALKARLRALGINDRTIVSVVPLRTGAAPSGLGFTAFRQVGITADSVANAGRTAAAVASSSAVEAVAIRYTLSNHASASREALNLALKDAENRAREAVTSDRLHIGALKTVVVSPDDDAPASRLVPFYLVPVVGGFKEPDIRIPDIDVHATATVTYAVKP